MHSAHCGTPGIRRIISIFAALLAAMFVVAGTSCSAHQTHAPVSAIGKGSAGAVIADDLGRKLCVPAASVRIVSLSPTATEILYAVGAQKCLVADTTRCNFPPAAKALPHLDGVSPSHERLIALHPDLILVSDQTLTVATADQLSRGYGAPVYVLAAANYAGAEVDILRLGTDFGSASKAEEIIRGMQAEEARVQQAVARLKKPRVFVVIWEAPLMTAGGGSFIDNLIGLAGGVNIAHADAKYPQYSIERLVAADPDIILTQTEGGPQSLALLRPLRLRAVRQGHVFAVPDDWSDRPGPRLALGLKSIAAFLHPEAFSK